jgi:hypothetical protein
LAAGAIRDQLLARRYFVAPSRSTVDRQLRAMLAKLVARVKSDFERLPDTVARLAAPSVSSAV